MPSDPTTFGPRDPVEGVYEREHPAILLERTLYAFQSVLMIPKPIVSRKFCKVLHEAILKDYPGLRCSAARAILEGRIPGIPKPTAEVHSSSVKRIQQALCLLDIFETIAHTYLEKEEKDRAQQDSKATPGHGRRGLRKRYPGNSKKGRRGIPRSRQTVREVSGQAPEETNLAEREAAPAI